MVCSPLSPSHLPGKVTLFRQTHRSKGTAGEGRDEGGAARDRGCRRAPSYCNYRKSSTRTVVLLKGTRCSESDRKLAYPLLPEAPSCSIHVCCSCPGVRKSNGRPLWLAKHSFMLPHNVAFSLRSCPRPVDAAMPHGSISQYLSSSRCAWSRLYSPSMLRLRGCHRSDRMPGLRDRAVKGVLEWQEAMAQVPSPRCRHHLCA